MISVAWTPITTLKTITVNFLLIFRRLIPLKMKWYKHLQNFWNTKQLDKKLFMTTILVIWASVFVLLFFLFKAIMITVDRLVF